MTALQTALGWALFHFLWQGAAIGIVLAIVLSFRRTARARYLLASLGMAAMVLSFAATLAVCWPANPNAAKTGASPLPPLRLAHVPQAANADLNALRQATPPVWMVPVWTGGVSLFYCYSLLAWLAASRLKKRGAFPAPLEWQQRLTHLAARLGLRRPIALMESCLTDVPVVIGYLRPVILLPLGLLAGLTAEQVEAILIHELAHIRRYDYLVNGMQTLVEGMLFYHPAVWWMGSVMRREREHCCDDIVVSQQGDAPAYAATLARLELSRGAMREPVLAATGGNLMKRIHRLLRQPEGPRIAAPLISAGVLLATATLGIAAWQTAAPQATPYAKWLNEDVAYIITDAERAAFKNLQTDPEREKFIEQFWLARDPTPGTPANEFKDEHYRRIAYANTMFASTVPGWKTDRGRIYIIYGPPDEIEDHPKTAASAQLWRYKYIEGMGNNVIMEFDDPAGTQEYRMTTDPAAKKELLAEQPLKMTAQVTPIPNQHLRIANISVHVEGAGDASHLQGRITAAGRPVAVFEEELDFSSGLYQKSLPLVPGYYRAIVTVKDHATGDFRQGDLSFQVR